jgi:hypothetical protein
MYLSFPCSGFGEGLLPFTGTRGAIRAIDKEIPERICSVTLPASEIVVSFFLLDGREE